MSNGFGIHKVTLLKDSVAAEKRYSQVGKGGLSIVIGIKKRFNNECVWL